MSADQKGEGDKIPEKEFEISKWKGVHPNQFKNQGGAKKRRKKKFLSGQTTLIFSNSLPKLSHPGEFFASSHDLTCTEHPKDKLVNDESGGKSKKTVHFADSKGLNLTEMRLYEVNKKTPEPPTSLLSNLKIDPDKKCAKTEKTVGEMSKKSPDGKRSGKKEVLELYETYNRYKGKSHTGTKKESTCYMVETPEDNISKEVLRTEQPPTTLKRNLNNTPTKVVANDLFIPRSDLAFEKAPLLKAYPENSGWREKTPISAQHPDEFSTSVPGLCYEKGNDSNNGVSKVKLDTQEPNSKISLTFVPLFKVRIPDLEAKLKKQMVILEDLVVTEKFIYGDVRTANVWSRAKEVYVRYTVDDCKTFRELPAEFKPEFSNLTKNVYSFSINLPVIKEGDLIKFYLKFAYQCKYSWRRYISEEYVLQCVSVQGGKN